MKKILVLITLALITIVSTFGCGKSENNTSDTNLTDDVVIRVGAMSGPTAMGMVKLMEDSANGQTVNRYEFADLATEASALVAPIGKGELDIACVPSNLAAKLYKNTNGEILILCTNTLGVQYVLSRDENIKEIADLKGKKIYATGAGAVPECVIRALFKANGIDADKDVELIFAADTTEALAYLKNDENAVGILPQPFATVACSQVEGMKMTMDLNDAWKQSYPDSVIVTGVVVARKQFVLEHRDAVNQFLVEYGSSIEFVNGHTAEASELIEKYGIVAKVAIAEKALPKCHIKLERDAEMQTNLEGFYKVLFETDKSVIGGEIPVGIYYSAN